MVQAEEVKHVPGSKRRELDLYPKGRYDKSNPQGGIYLDDSESSVTKVIKSMMYNMGSSLIKGKLTDLLKMSSPAFVHLPKTYLHMI